MRDCKELVRAQHWVQTVRPDKGIQSGGWKPHQISC